jgi:hypothetical protein
MLLLFYISTLAGGGAMIVAPFVVTVSAPIGILLWCVYASVTMTLAKLAINNDGAH